MYYRCSCITFSVLKLVAACNLEQRYSLFFNVKERRLLYLSTFPDNLSTPSFKEKAIQEVLACLFLEKWGPVNCRETSINNYKTTMRNIAEE